MSFLGSLTDLSKSPILKAALSSLDSAIDSINEKHKLEPVTLEDLVCKFSHDTDRVILGIEREESLRFVGGHLKISLSKVDIYFSMTLDLYFEKSDGKVFLKQLSRNMPKSLLNKDSITELQSSNEIKFEVTEPKR